MPSIAEALLEKVNELTFEIQRLSRRVQMQNMLTAIGNPFSMPASKYWTWFQKTAPTAFTILLGQNADLVDTKQLPSSAGYLHSLDIQTDNDVTVVFTYNSAGGQEQVLKGAFSAFRAAGFNKFIPASAGDPIVMNDPTDGGPAAIPWKVRVSPNWNLPFNTPFNFKLQNDIAGNPTVTVLGFDFYFWLLTKEAINLIEEIEAEAVDMPPILKPFTFEQVPAEEKAPSG